MRKWLMFLFVLLLLATLAAAGLLLYIRPSEPLNMNYEPLSVREKALAMARERTTTLVLTEADVNSLAKAKLDEDRWVGPDTEVIGARFALEETDALVADLNVRWKGRVTAQLQVTYRLSWAAPNLIATAEEVHMKGIELPASVAPDFVVPVGDELPDLLQIRSIDIGGDELTVEFKLPSLRDLAKLLG